MKENINWEDIAKNLLEQEIVPGFSKEIVLLSKSSSHLNQELVSAIKKLDKERLELYIDDTIGLEGRQHVLRRLDDKLVYMTDRQNI